MRWDGLLVVTLGIAAGLLTFHNASRMSPLVFSTRAQDLLFDADTADYVSMMTVREGPHGETKVHPLLTLFIYPPVKILRSVLDLEPTQAIRVTLALVAALWAGTLFGVLRLIGCREPDSAIFTLLGVVSAAAQFWFAVPETGSYGSLSILAAVGVMALAQRWKISELGYAAVSAFTLSTTVTNWMAGIFLSFINLPRRRALKLTAIAFGIVVALAGLQEAIFPRADFFLQNPKKGAFLFHPRSGGPVKIVPAFIFHTMIMPAIENTPKNGALRLTTQQLAPGSGSPWGRAAVWFWGALLGVGAWWAVSNARSSKLVQLVGFTLLGQLVLHLVFGKETFLQALHFLPLLIVLAAFGTFTRARPGVLLFAAALTVCAFINNQLIFEQAATQVDRYEELIGPG